MMQVVVVVVASLLLASGAAEPTALYHKFQPLLFQPRIATPTNFELVDQTPDNRSALYHINLTKGDAYHSGPVLFALLEGTPKEVGQAFGHLLGERTDFLYTTWLHDKFPSTVEIDVVAALLDWLWDEGLSKFTPKTFLDELEGIAAVQSNVKDLVKKVTRIVTLSNLPADTQNIERVILDLLLAGNTVTLDRLRTLCGAMCSGAGSDSDAVAHAAAAILHKPNRSHGPGMCDYFAAWGNNTEDGRLLSSRNLDFDRDVDVSTGKIVTVVRYTGADAIPYATFGTPGYWGALAGVSAAGITVSEANLDNADVSFRGIPWPLRLRQILDSASSLADARSIWAAAPNSAAFNFLVASAIDVNTTSSSGAQGVTQAAMALETTFKHTSEFGGADTVEDSATFKCDCELVNTSSAKPVCVNGTVRDGVACNWPYTNDTVSIGASLPNAVFRSNHGLHPATMATQEPLWNDTVMRYYMLHDAIEEYAARPDRITSSAAVNITAYLGIKGSNYTSCDPQYFPQPTENNGNTMSIVYDPSHYTAYAAWADGTIKGQNWSPAACNTYIHLNLQRWFYPYY